MASLDIDVIKDIPGYKVILKTVLKNQIQHLVEQLSSTTDEESVILTASISDGSLSHMGSDLGQGFIEDHKDLKSQFLSFCLKKQYSNKQQENERPEAESLATSIQNSPVYSSERLPRSCSSMAVRFEPYPMTRSRRSDCETRQTHVVKVQDRHLITNEPKNDNEVSNLCKSDKQSSASNILTQTTCIDNINDDTAQPITETNSDPGNDNGNDETYPCLSVKLESIAETLKTYAEIDSDLECEGVEPMGNVHETMPEIMSLDPIGTVSDTEQDITGLDVPQVMHAIHVPNVLLDVKNDPYSEETCCQRDVRDTENNTIQHTQCENSKHIHSSKAVQTHAYIHTDTKPVICTKCGKAFDDSNLSTGPSGSHTIVKSFQCETCSNESTLDGQFNRPSAKKVKKIQHKCKECGKCFAKKYSLNEHLVVHTGIKPFICDICGQTFTQNSSLTTHVNLHSGVKPFKCDICEKSFPLKSYLTRHMFVHSDVKPFTCDVCEKSFSHKCNLTKHMLVHSGVKPFKCDICEKSFTQKGDWKRHITVHSDVKPFNCDKCGTSFKHKSSMVIHMKSCLRK